MNGRAKQNNNFIRKIYKLSQFREKYSVFSMITHKKNNCFVIICYVIKPATS